MSDHRCYGVYQRRWDGLWLYSWGAPVPGAVDITVRDVLRIGPANRIADVATSEGLEAYLRQDGLVDHDPGIRVSWDDATSLDHVVGLDAPELHVRAMLAMPDVAAMTGISPDTVAAYRYRGYLPEPQAIIGRVPVWSRPIIGHWMRTRPGSGWRTDIYGGRDEYSEYLFHRRAARVRSLGRPPAV